MPANKLVQYDYRENASSNGTGITTATTADLIAAPGATKQLVILDIWLQNLSATEVLCQVKEESGIIHYEVKLEEKMPFSKQLFPKSLRLAANKKLQLITSAAGDIRWSVGYEISDI